MCIRMCTRMCMCMCAYANVYVYAYVYVYVYVRVLVSVRMNVCVWLKQAFAAENRSPARHGDLESRIRREALQRCVESRGGYHDVRIVWSSACRVCMYAFNNTSNLHWCVCVLMYVCM